MPSPLQCHFGTEMPHGGGQFAAMRFQSFGTMLYWLRVDYGRRVANSKPGQILQKTKLTQAEVVSRLERADYTNISPATYSELESGKTLPKNGQDFLRAIAEALELTEAEQSALREQLAYDVLKDYLGEGFADEKFAEH